MVKLVSAFPGTGKSFAKNALTQLGQVVSDSDSSGFPKQDFPDNYIQHIKQLIDEGKHDVIFISSHDVVRAALEKEGLDYTLVYPDIDSDVVSAKADYMKRYVTRGSPTPFLELMDKNFEDFVISCSKPTLHSKHVKLPVGTYLLDALDSL